MPFLENLILGKPGGPRRQRYAEDRGLTGSEEGRTQPRLGPFFTTLGIVPSLPVDRASGDAQADGEALRDNPPGGGEPRLCGNLACGRSWTLPWKSRTHPVFDGQWACSKACLAALVKTALTREAADGVYEDGPEPHHHRIPLGLVMLAQGWITHPQLQAALEAQRAHGSGRIGEWLVSECGMRPERIARGLGAQWNCPVLSIEGFWPEAMALALPRILLEEYGVVPLRVAGRKILYVGFQDSLDASASFAIEQMTGLRVESGVLPDTEFARARQILLRCEFPREEIAAVGDRNGLARAIAETVEQQRSEASRLVRLHRYYWLRVWAKGSDRAAGDLPTNANAVRDYLFTIGSRMARSRQKDWSVPSIAVEESDGETEETVEVSAAASVGPTKGAEKANRSVESAIDERWPAAGAEPAFVPEADELAAIKVDKVHEVDEVEEDTFFEPRIAAKPTIPWTAYTEPSYFGEEEEHITGPDGELDDGLEIGKSQYEIPARHSLARLEPWFNGLARGDEQATQPRTAPEYGPTRLDGFARNGLDAAVEPIDGEYLPVESAGVASTALVSETRSPNWIRFGPSRKQKPSFPGLELDPALDPGQEV